MAICNQKTAGAVEEKLKPALVSMATLVARPDFSQCPDHVRTAFTDLYQDINGFVSKCQEAKRDGSIQLPAMCSTVKDPFIIII